MSAFASRGQFHYSDHDLMVQPVMRNPFPGVLQVTNVVECVKIANGGHTMLFEHFGMEIDHVFGLLGECP